MFALTWGDNVDALARLGLRVGATGETWRGVREPQRWVCRVDDADAVFDGIGAQMFDSLGSWNAVAFEDAPVANFVIRVVAPHASEDIRTQLLDQANAGDGVLSRPGCLGLTLAAAIGHREAMLGVSYWPSVEDFDAYATWAQTAPWKDVVTPVTVDVPLRLLAHRTAESTGE